MPEDVSITHFSMENVSRVQPTQVQPTRGVQTSSLATASFRTRSFSSPGMVSLFSFAQHPNEQSPGVFFRVSFRGHVFEGGAQ